MTFYGQEPPAPTDKPVRVFTYETRGGQQRRVEAHYVQFMPGHVSFWLETGEAWDSLVLAESNRDCNRVEERA